MSVWTARGHWTLKCLGDILDTPSYLLIGRCLVWITDLWPQDLKLLFTTGNVSLFIEGFSQWDETLFSFFFNIQILSLICLYLQILINRVQTDKSSGQILLWTNVSSFILKTIWTPLIHYSSCFKSNLVQNSFQTFVGFL